MVIFLKVHNKIRTVFSEGKFFLCIFRVVCCRWGSNYMDFIDFKIIHGFHYI